MDANGHARISVSRTKPPAAAARSAILDTLIRAWRRAGIGFDGVEAAGARLAPQSPGRRQFFLQRDQVSLIGGAMAAADHPVRRLELVEVSMLGSWWRRMRGRTGAPAARRHPEPQLPSDSLFDDLRHEAAAQCQAAASVYPSTPAPLSRTLEKTVAATEKREKAARR